MDFGAGSGRVLFSAVAEGAYRSHGYELPENKGMKYVFDAMLIASATLTQDRVEWIAKDILDLKVLKGSPSCAYSFWVGFSLPVQERILRLCSETSSMQAIAVFKDAKWVHADRGMLSTVALQAQGIVVPCRKGLNASGTCNEVQADKA